MLLFAYLFELIHLYIINMTFKDMIYRASLAQIITNA